MTLALLILLGASLRTAPVMPTTQQPKGPVRSVYAERSGINPVTGESERSPWYRERYDTRGRLLESTFFKQEGSINNTWMYLYADDNKCSEAAVYDSNNRLRWREVYTYDEKGVLRGATLSGPDGLSTVRYIFKYDNIGRKTEWVRSEASGREYTKESYKYDSSGRVSDEMIYAAPGLLDSRIVYSYDARGEIGSKREYSSNNAIVHDWTYKYKYDSQGNWVQQIAYDRFPAGSGTSSGKAKELIYRSIEYSNGK